MNTALALILIIISFSLLPPLFSLAPWVPTKKKDLDRVLTLAGLKPGENFYDLGCGTGIVVFYAADKFQANAIGIELSWPLVIFCWIKKFFSNSRSASFRLQNLFNTNLQSADVVYLFGIPDTLNQKLLDKLKSELKPGARVLSYCFPVKNLVASTISRPTDKDLPIYLYKF